MISLWTEYIETLWFDATSIDEVLLTQTLTHKSYAMDFPDGEVTHNERLEFLWDSLLWAVIAWLLFKDFPDLAESHLTLSKIFLVKEHTLAEVARKINLWSVMRLWTWEERSGGRNKDAVLSDGLEAFIAFIYLQYGRTAVESFIEKHIYSILGKQPVMPTKSWKNQLQELVQKYHNELPIYIDHELIKDKSGDVKVFWSDVIVLWKLVCQWEGKNKKRAQENGAMKAMEKLTILDNEVILL